MEYAQLLIQECRNLNLIGDKIWIWDQRFFECNCSGLKNKETGMLSDPDAGHYVKKTGTYSVLSAVLHQLDQKIIYPHYDFKHLTEKYFEIRMKLRNS